MHVRNACWVISGRDTWRRHGANATEPLAVTVGTTRTTQIGRAARPRGWAQNSQPAGSGSDAWGQEATNGERRRREKRWRAVGKERGSSPSSTDEGQLPEGLVGGTRRELGGSARQDGGGTVLRQRSTGGRRWTETAVSYGKSGRGEESARGQGTARKEGQ